MNLYKKTLVVFFCILFVNIAYSQKDSLQLLDKRLKNLEEYKVNIDQLYVINSEKLSKHIDEKIEEKIKDIDEAKKILNWFLFLGIPGTIGGLIAVYFGAVRKAKKMIIDKIENIVEHKREELIKLIETQEFDSKLRNTKRLLVLSTGEESNAKIKQDFGKFKFKNVSHRIVTTYTEFTDFDLIIFNDSDGSFSQDIIDSYIKNIPDEHVSFVAYTTKNLTRNPRINFSNSYFTLYHSILTTLKYSEILKII